MRTLLLLMVLVSSGVFQDPPFRKGAGRNHRAVSRRLLCGHYGARARRWHVETAGGQRAGGEPARRGRRGRLQIRRLAEARRLFAGVEFELDIDHLPLRAARLRLQSLRRGGAGAGGIAAARGARRREMEDARRVHRRREGAPGQDQRGELRNRQPHAHLLGRALQGGGSGGVRLPYGAGQVVPNCWAATSTPPCSCPGHLPRTSSPAPCARSLR